MSTDRENQSGNSQAKPGEGPQKAMPLILGTAGHIDHGKTSLVRALTGVDCDRLPEEKARGITIDIGFAHLDISPYRVGVVDVPGHERFVRNMLAGATGFDLAMLVVAADDSIMPQTREHLEILRLLGLEHGIIALTKCDLVDETTREVVELEVRELVHGSFLEEAPILHTSASTGAGIPELREALKGAAAKCLSKPRPRDAGWFRMAIDRSFVMQGHGTVVTGTVLAGQIRVGEEIDWLPKGERVRVRGLRRHGEPVDFVSAGMRAAINLAGVKHEDVQRGQELATPGVLQPTRVLATKLRLLPGAKPLRHRQQVRVHLGTLETIATLSLLDCDKLAPGEEGLVQLFLEDQALAVWGQPLVVRQASAQQTLGGGRVIQATGRKLRRRHLKDLEHLEQQACADHQSRARVTAWFSGYGGISPADLVREAGWTLEEAEGWTAQGLADGSLVEISLGGTRKRLLETARVEELEAMLLEALIRLHDREPLLSHHERQKVEAQLGWLNDQALAAGVLDRLIKRKVVVGPQGRVGKADFKPRLTAGQRRLKEQILEAYRQAGFQPPDKASFSAVAGQNAGSLDELFGVCVAEAALEKVQEGLYLASQHERAMREKVAAELGRRVELGQPGLTVAEIRDLLGTTRKYAVPLCEYLDRVAITRREGDLRWLAPNKMAENPVAKG